jgi:NADH:ubiquinone reductase (H+-translocating)
MDLKIPSTGQKRLVIIGGGFAGIELTRHLKKADVQVVMLDQHNYHNFQPLMYQVATGGLEPGSIAYPLRKFMQQIPNAIFRLAKVLEVLPHQQILKTDIGELSYDYLAIATGSQTNFFNLDEASVLAMKQLKSIPQSLDIRSYILENFEEALLCSDPVKKEALMNIAIVGGGPTGVELAGALAEMQQSILPKDYPELDFKKMQVHLFEAQGGLLNGMTEASRNKALKYVRDFGVKVWLNTSVKSYQNGHLELQNGEVILAETVIWAAGVKGAPIQGLAGEAYLPNGRIEVDEYNRIKGMNNVFAVGDVAFMSTADYPKGHPMVAPVAIQQGILLAENIQRWEKNQAPQAFQYFDKGAMATIGRNKAVVDFPGGHLKLGGFLAWIAWMFVHLMYLIGFRNKLIVMIGWMYNYLNYDRTLRLIIRPSKYDRDIPKFSGENGLKSPKKEP